MEQDHTNRLRDEAKRIKSEQDKELSKFQNMLKNRKKEVRRGEQSYFSALSMSSIVMIKIAISVCFSMVEGLCCAAYRLFLHSLLCVWDSQKLHTWDLSAINVELQLWFRWACFLQMLLKLSSRSFCTLFAFVFLLYSARTNCCFAVVNTFYILAVFCFDGALLL